MRYNELERMQQSHGWQKMRNGRERRKTFRKRERRMNGRVEESEDEKERWDYLRKTMTTRKRGRRINRLLSFATKKEGSNC